MSNVTTKSEEHVDRFQQDTVTLLFIVLLVQPAATYLLSRAFACMQSLYGALQKRRSCRVNIRLCTPPNLP